MLQPNRLTFLNAVYGQKSIVELKAELAKVETKGKEQAARLAKGDKGDVVGQHMVKGDWQPTYAVEASLNALRGMYRDIRDMIEYKQA
jgi:hypothetical protein